MRYLTDAIVIQKAPFSESSQIVHLLTAREGRVLALARGAFRPRSGFGGPLDLLVRGEADLLRRTATDLDVLYSFQVKAPYRGIRRSARAWGAGCYLLELATAFSYLRDREAGMFDLLRHALDAIDTATLAEEIESWLLGFAVHALRRAGLAPRVDACGGCGSDRPLGQPDHQEFLSPTAGGVLCRACRSAEAIAVPSAALDLLARLLGHAARPAQSDGQAIRAARRAVDLYLEYRMEAPTRSRHFLERVLCEPAAKEPR